MTFPFRSRDAQDRVCEILDALLSRLMNADGAPVLGPLLQPVIFALAECMDSNSKAISNKSLYQSNAAAGLIQKLVTKVYCLMLIYLSYNNFGKWSRDKLCELFTQSKIFSKGCLLSLCCLQEALAPLH